MRLIHDLGRSIELRGDGGDLPLWRYVYAGRPKPFFHPVCTPAGHCLTNFEPHDHLWHRGLWFTIKFINGENFWEERAPFGTQVSGVPEVRSLDPRNPDKHIELASRIEWLRPAGQGCVINEERRIAYVAIAADAYALDFDLALTATADLVLDRTPYTTWGGYGGLVLRGTRNWQQTRILLSDGAVTERPTGQRAAWADLSGKLDGGPTQAGGFAIFDHPGNPRHPTPWYGGAEKHQNYLNAALLFHEPLSFARGQSLRLRYRVLIHDGLWDAERLSACM